MQDSGTVRNYAFIELVDRNLPNEPLCRFQYGVVTCGQICRRKLLPIELNTEELGHILQILGKGIALSDGDYGNVAQAHGFELIHAARRVEHVDDVEVFDGLRKKLFRFQATASPGLGE